jgi:hypothetical protein
MTEQTQIALSGFQYDDKARLKKDGRCLDEPAR